ncbi:MAG: DUF3592 domain-containing protein [Pseudomonadota bacterium]|nr:DUF3592 domain-containing protein [Pseudomonadota bacterium]
MVFPLLYCLFGALGLWYARRLYSDVRVGRAWPTVPGTILERRVGAPMKAHRRSFLPYVKYTYTVSGQAHTNDQVYLIPNTGGYADRIQQLVDSLPSPVPVHYDPKDPARSFLIVNPMGIIWILFTFGGGALLLGLMLLFTWAVLPSAPPPTP